ncbi:hypothetical protein C8J57DRAFT_1647516 [Mycena rebaudengoi]|nr:hypothetical protein C8J57DRAFT_1647516 [Mycena rebaudengoi]
MKLSFTWLIFAVLVAESYAIPAKPAPKPGTTKKSGSSPTGVTVPGKSSKATPPRTTSVPPKSTSTNKSSTAPASRTTSSVSCCPAEEHFCSIQQQCIRETQFLVEACGFQLRIRVFVGFHLGLLKRETAKLYRPLIWVLVDACSFQLRIWVFVGFHLGLRKRETVKLHRPLICGVCCSFSVIRLWRRFRFRLWLCL